MIKESVKSSNAPVKFMSNELVAGIFMHITAAVCGFLASRAEVVGKFAPFGTAFAAGVPRTYLLTASIGAMAGYIFPITGGSGFRYIAALFAIISIRMLLQGVGKISKSPAWSMLVAFVVVTATSAAISFSNISELPYSLAEGILSGGCAYFVNRAYKVRPNEKPGLRGEELVSMLFLLSVLLMGLFPLSVGGVSFGRIAAVVIVLTAARYGQASAGAISGVMVSFSIALCSMSYPSVIPIFAAAGLFAGFFSALGRLGSVFGFIVTCLVAALISGNVQQAVIVGIEAVIGAGVFLLLPQNVGVMMGRIFAPPAEMPRLEGLKGALVMRLEFASSALHDVSATVEEVSKELSRINSPDFDTVLKKIEGDACRGCSLCVHCWETMRSETVEAVLGISKSIRQKDGETRNAAGENFYGRCLRFRDFTEAIEKHYSDFTARRNAELRIEEVRSVISDQFDGISNMLYDLATEFKCAQKHDARAAENIVMVLRGMDIHATDCACAVDKYGRMSADIKVKNTSGTVLNRMDIMRRLSEACDRDFDAPCISQTASEAFISINEKANYKVEIGITQISGSESAMCGDACQYFSDGKGHFIMLLSDGMGSGGRAAVDSAMVSGLMSRLIKSGFGYDCSLRIVNSSMLFKSTDESLATVDIASVDLFTGETELFKAGAAPTIVRRNGRTGKAESTSLPAGILREVGFDRAAVKLKTDDIVVMISDGASGEGIEWICAEVEAWGNGTARQLADKIASSARRRRSDGHQDDITVMAAILQDAV